jgi:hypothetical protein
MSNRETWKPLRKTVPAADADTQKELGMIAAAWRQSIAAQRSEEMRSDWFESLLKHKVKPQHVRQRLAALDPKTAARITRRFGDNFDDALTRARVFEVCDFVYFEGDEDRLAEHETLPWGVV